MEHDRTRLLREALSVQVDLEPCIEVHRCGIGRHADVTQVAVDVARGNVEAAVKGDREVSLVPPPF